MHRPLPIFFFFFFNDTATTEIYTLSLHDALPISHRQASRKARLDLAPIGHLRGALELHDRERSEEHTSELQSHSDLVCRLLLEKKKKKRILDKEEIVNAMEVKSDRDVDDTT